MSSTKKVEEGFALFQGESLKAVDLVLASQPGQISTTIVELPNTYNTGSSANSEKDIPSRYYGTVQVAAYWTATNNVVGELNV